MDAEEVYIACQPATLYLKVRGHITAKHCRELRRRLKAAHESDGEFRELTVDLTECSYMDSTFLGLLVIFNRKYCLPAGRQLVVFNPSSTCESLLRDVGLLNLITVQRGSHPGISLKEKLTCADTITADLLLKTHEELMGLSEENKQRFSLIHKLLQQESFKQK